MTNTDRKQLQLAINVAQSQPKYAAATICCTANAQRTQAGFAECFRLIDELGLRGHTEVINGAIYAKP